MHHYSSLDNEGYGRIEKISFETYNESTCLIEAIERFRERTGYYPERVLADQIYRTRENRNFCKEICLRFGGEYFAFFYICSEFGADIKSGTYKYLLNQQTLSNNLSSDAYDKEKYALEKQLIELSCKVRKLFGNHADGVIDVQNYEMLMKDTQVKQTSLERKLSSLQLRISDQHNFELYLTQFRNTVKELAEVTVLTPSILNKLIERIKIVSLNLSDRETQLLILIWRCRLTKYVPPF